MGSWLHLCSSEHYGMSTSFCNSLGICSSWSILLLLIFRVCRDQLPWLRSYLSFPIHGIPISLRGPSPLWRVSPDPSSPGPVPEPRPVLCVPGRVHQAFHTSDAERTRKCKFSTEGGRALLTPEGEGKDHMGIPKWSTTICCHGNQGPACYRLSISDFGWMGGLTLRE